MGAGARFFARQALLMASLGACGHALAGGVSDLFLNKAQGQFKTFGFGVDARAIDFDQGGEGPAKLLAALRPGPAAVFSGVSPGRCVVGWRASAWGGAPERLLEAAAVASGGERQAIWRLMIRHEFGHCALGAMATDAQPRLGPRAEGFADAFALAWGKADGESERDLRAYIQGRSLSGGGAGPGALEKALGPDWMSGSGSPCVKAWRAFAWDSRLASKACSR